MQVNLGDEVKDNVTGFTGICVARTQWLNGCIRVVLQSSKLDKEGKPMDGHTFDEPQCTVIEAHKVSAIPTTAPTATRGGPKPMPTRPAAAVR